jgi:hypothetical protein
MAEFPLFLKNRGIVWWMQMAGDWTERENRDRSLQNVAGGAVFHFVQVCLIFNC